MVALRAHSVTNEAAPSPDKNAAPIERLGTPMGAGKPIPANGAPAYLFLAIISVATLGADIASKLWAEKALDLQPPMHVIEGKTVNFGFQLARNHGGAWGLLQGSPENLRRPFFLLVSALAIGFIVYLFSRLQPRQRALKWGLPLVLGGALGNVFDRIRYGWVIDFIDVHFIKSNGQEWHWPTFNVADIAICVGVGLMAIDMFGSKRGAEKKSDKDDDDAPAKDEPPAETSKDAPESKDEPAEAAAKEETKEEAGEAKTEKSDADKDAEHPAT